ncbi:MAG: ABC transporter ATP-binding protein [Bacteroidota bacterium]
METVLEIKNLTKRYGRITAVNELSLEVKRGEVFGILGPNGSGKTTTLGIILDVINSNGGGYQWFGQPGSKETRKRVGAVLESPIFYPYLTAVKNLEIVARIKEVPLDNIDKVLKQVGLYERRDYNFKTYSLGMKQRLSIASALLCDPEVMILDEPTNGLDPMGIAQIRDLIKDIAKSGKTIILASHLLDEVQKVCTHFAVLNRGKKLYQGLVEDVGKGAQEVEVRAEHDGLEDVLKAYPKASSVKFDSGSHIVTMKEGGNSAELNAYLFEKGITASHLFTQKRTLEKQFLEILAESK